MAVSPDEAWEATSRDRDRRLVEGDIEIGPDVRALLSHAAELTGTGDAETIIRVALEELIERRRFQNWVDAHDRALLEGDEAGLPAANR